MSALVETMAYVGETPWHGLGFPVNNDLTVEEFLKAAKLNWEVGKFDNFTEVNGVKVPTGTQALVRTSDNRVLSPSVGKEWQFIQNEEVFGFFKEFVEAGKMKMHTAGSLKGGRRVWALASLNEEFELFGGDVVSNNLLFSASHQYGVVHQIDWTPVRVVCWNTLSYALEGESKYAASINHTQRFDPEKVKETLGLARGKMNSYREAAELLGSKRAKPAKAVEYADQLFPFTGKEADVEDEVENEDGPKRSRNSKKLVELIDTQPGAEFAQGTWWQVYNAATYLIDHKIGRNQDNRLHSAWFGGARDRKNKALDLALEMAA